MLHKLVKMVNLNFELYYTLSPSVTSMSLPAVCPVFVGSEHGALEFPCF